MLSATVVGLGYIGLPLSLSLCEKGYRVAGVDVNVDKVEALKAGVTDVMEDLEGVSLQTVLRKHLHSGAFVPKTRLEEAASHGSTYIITVGIPVTKNNALVTTPLTMAMQQLGRVLKRKDLVLVRSTVPPGMVEDVCAPILAHYSGMVPGLDFHVAYAAERVAEGRAMQEFQTLDIVVGGLTDKCAAATVDLLSRLTSGKIHITDIRTAQAVKVIENVQRDVNIALAHEIKKFAEYHHIDVYELIRMANTHPRVKLLEPGIGVGGFCIPNALHYMMHSLEPDAKETLPLLKLARQINHDIPDQVVTSITESLLLDERPLKGALVSVLGLGMKDNSNDVRQSPAMRLVELLHDQGAVVRAYDPLVPLQFPFQTKTMKECTYDCDALIVAAWHDVFENEDVATALSVTKADCIIYDRKRRLARYLGPVVDGVQGTVIAL